VNDNLNQDDKEAQEVNLLSEEQDVLHSISSPNDKHQSSQYRLD
jgi:hypothetical protein